MGLRQALDLMRVMNEGEEEPLAGVYNISGKKYGLIIFDDKRLNFTLCATFADVLKIIRA